MDREQSELSTWLEELEAEHAARALVIASVRQRLGLAADGDLGGQSAPNHTGGKRGTEVVTGPLRSDTFFRLSVPDAIKKYLAMAKRPQSPKEIAVALKQGGVLSQAAHFYANVTTALKRLKDSGDVVNTKEGWGLAAWYPNKPKADVPAPKKKTARAKPVSRKKSRSHRPKKATTGGWHQFLGEAAKEGKTMAEAAAEWREIKTS